MEVKISVPENWNSADKRHWSWFTDRGSYQHTGPLPRLSPYWALNSCLISHKQNQGAFFFDWEKTARFTFLSLAIFLCKTEKKVFRLKFPKNICLKSNSQTYQSIDSSQYQYLRELKDRMEVSILSRKREKASWSESSAQLLPATPTVHAG